MVKTSRRVPRRTRRARSKVALVCAGGGITGAVYEIGCLRALEDLLDRSVADLDLYVGVSGGAFVTSLLANGVSPREMYDAVAAPRRGTLTDPTGALFRVGLGEFWRRSLRAPRVVTDALLAALRGRGAQLERRGLGPLRAAARGPARQLGHRGVPVRAVRRRAGAETTSPACRRRCT